MNTLLFSYIGGFATRSLSQLMVDSISPRGKFAPGDIIDSPGLLYCLSISRLSFEKIVTKLHLHQALFVLLRRGAPAISKISCKSGGVRGSGRPYTYLEIKKSAHVVAFHTFRLDHGIKHQTAMTITHSPRQAPQTPPDP
jgi:hypothetical protein